MAYSGKVTIMSIDPGSCKMGLAIMTLHLPAGVVIVDYVNTINIEALTKVYKKKDISVYGMAYAKQVMTYEIFRKHLDLYEPELVATESPYMGRFALAFSTLTKCLHSGQKATSDHDPDMGYFYYDPASVKLAVKVSGKSGDKDLMRNAVKSIKDIIIENVEFDLLDEHSIDAIAVGYTHAEVIKQGLPL